MWNHDISRFWIPGVGDVKDTHDKNVETVKCETPKYVDLTPFQSFGYWELEESRKQLTVGTRDMRNHEKIWIIESSRLWTVDLTPFRSFRYRELEESRVETLHHKSPEVEKCEMLKSRNRNINWSFGYQELEESRVKTLHHRSLEVVKCETLKSQNRHIKKDSILEFCRLGNQISKEL